MLFNGTRFFAFLNIFIIMISVIDARSWDLAVTLGHEVDLYLKNGTLVRSIGIEDMSSKLTSITYDDASHMMFLGGNKEKNVSIFSNNLQLVGSKINSLLTDSNSSYIMGIVHDPLSQTLFWTDKTRRVIFKMPFNKNISTAEPKILIHSPSDVPRGLSLDVCNRRLYWTTMNGTNSKIMSSNMDATSQSVIISENIYNVVAITIDHTSGKLYWLGAEGIHYRIERSNLDGTNREELVAGKNQQPIQIAVDDDTIYWTDWVYRAIWSIKKDAVFDDTPTTWMVVNTSLRDTDPTGIFSRDYIANINCDKMKEAQKNSLISEKRRNKNDRYNTPVISIEENGSTYTTLKFCLNDGFFNKSSKTCQCKHGFNGIYCEQSVCENYCFHGECKLMVNSQVFCECAPEYTGQRCEKYVCSDYCFNGGICSIRGGKPFCTCKFSRGDRCENLTDITDLCTVFCASRSHRSNNVDGHICSCSKNNTTNQEYIYHYNSWTKILVAIFSTIIGVLTALILILSYFVNKYRRRPRVKKRFVVSKMGITPLTSRPQLPEGQCEIMIENCCNMNICETPCFEPKLRNSQSSTMKKEEKNSLLENIDGNNSC